MIDNNKFKKLRTRLAFGLIIFGALFIALDYWFELDAQITTWRDENSVFFPLATLLKIGLEASAEFVGIGTTVLIFDRYIGGKVKESEDLEEAIKKFEGYINGGNEKIKDAGYVKDYIKGIQDAIEKKLITASPITSLKGCNLTQVENLKALHPGVINLESVNMNDADLTDLDLSKITVDYIKLNNSTLKKVNLSGSSLFDAGLIHAELIDVDLMGTDLPYAKLQEACLQNITSTKECNLANANLTKATLKRVTLTGVSLANATLENVNLENVNLTNADLTNVDFRNTILNESVILRGANMGGMKHIHEDNLNYFLNPDNRDNFNDQTIFPSGQKLQENDSHFTEQKFRNLLNIEPTLG